MFALIDPEVFALSPDELKAALKIAAPEPTARRILADRRESGTEVTIVLYHGPYERARALASELVGLDVLGIGHEQRLVGAERAGGTTIVSRGADGAPGEGRAHGQGSPDGIAETPLMGLR